MDLVHVVVTGTLQPGFTQVQVADNLKSLLKLNEPQINKLLTTSGPLFIKKNIALKTGEQLAIALTRCGLQARTVSAQSLLRPEAIPENPINVHPISAVKISDHPATRVYTKMQPDMHLDQPSSTAVSELSLVIEKPVLQDQKPEDTLPLHNTYHPDFTSSQDHVAELNPMDNHESWNEDDEVPDNPIADIPDLFSASFIGRYGRLNFINALIVFWLCIFFIGLAARLIPYIEIIVVLPLTLLALAFQSRILALRFQDLNYSENYSFILVLTELIGIYTESYILLGLCGAAILLLMILPGTSGINRYNEPSEQGGWYGLVITIILLFLIPWLDIIHQILYTLNNYDLIFKLPKPFNS